MSLFKLPRETIMHIFRFVAVDLEPQTIIRLQRTSKKIKNYLWKAVDRLDLNKWSTEVDPNILLDRLDNNIVTFLDLTGYNYIDSKGNELSTSDILRRYPALEILKVDEIPANDFAELEKTLPTHKCLVEIVTFGTNVDERHRKITEHIRLVMRRNEEAFPQVLDVPTFNCESAMYLVPTQCTSTCKLDFSSALTSNGITIKGTTFLGGADGSIFVVQKQNGAMKMTQHIIEHTGAISYLYRVAKTDIIFAASEDGTVSKWQWTRSKLNLICKYSFPAPVCFVAGDDPSRMAVASKHTLYFILSERISENVHQFEEEITDLEIKDRRFNYNGENSLFVNTATYCYESVDFRGISKQEKDKQNPNGPVCRYFERLYSDSSSNSQDTAYIFMGSYTLKQNFRILAMQLDYNVVVCGSVIQFEYERYDAEVVGRLSPRLSRAEITAKKFPECKCIWYSQDYLYAIFSNNKLYRWSLGISGRYGTIDYDD